MNTFYTLILFLLADVAYGQSNLPSCKGSDVSRWSNCIGEETQSGQYQYKGEFFNGKKSGFGVMTVLHPDFKGDKYVGEWRDDKYNGQGTFYFLADNKFKGDKYVGESKDGKSDGQGTYTFANGNSYVGVWSEGKYNGRGTLTYANGDKYVGEFKDGKYFGQGTFFRSDGRIDLGQWIENKPDGPFIKYRADGTIESSGFFSDGKLVTSRIINPNTFNRIGQSNTASAVQSAARHDVDQAKAQQEQAKKASRISISASATQPDSGGVVTINVQTNTDTSSLKINGEELGGKADGNYSVKRVARVGQETKFTIAGVDVNGNTDTKTITVIRQAVDSKAVFGQLNAANVKQQPAKDAVAIIIGIEKYKRVAKADFANADAQDFYDYAVRALGVKPENIKLLVDEGADDVEIYKAFQNWLPVKVKKGKTDVYVFYSGHGYPGQDGNSLYILPFGADKDLISKTAINQQEIVNAIQSAQPRNVTMFLDSCYSGQTRSGDVLIAGARPIAPKIYSNSYPLNFTVISASSNDQISSASPDLKHGIFSYFLMKGMEGDADQNKDGKTTIAEMHEYLTDMVGRQAMGMSRKQQPQLYGDPNKILVTQ